MNGVIAWIKARPSIVGGLIIIVFGFVLGSDVAKRDNARDAAALNMMLATQPLQEVSSSGEGGAPDGSVGECELRDLILYVRARNAARADGEPSELAITLRYHETLASLSEAEIDLRYPDEDVQFMNDTLAEMQSKGFAADCPPPDPIGAVAAMLRPIKLYMPRAAAP